MSRTKPKDKPAGWYAVKPSVAAVQTEIARLETLSAVTDPQWDQIERMLTEHYEEGYRAGYKEGNDHAGCAVVVAVALGIVAAIGWVLYVMAAAA